MRNAAQVAAHLQEMWELPPDHAEEERRDRIREHYGLMIAQDPDLLAEAAIEMGCHKELSQLFALLMWRRCQTNDRAIKRILDEMADKYALDYAERKV